MSEYLHGLQCEMSFLRNIKWNILSAKSESDFEGTGTMADCPNDSCVLHLQQLDLPGLSPPLCASHCHWVLQGFFGQAPLHPLVHRTQTFLRKLHGKVCWLHLFCVCFLADDGLANCFWQTQSEREWPFIFPWLKELEPEGSLVGNAQGSLEVTSEAVNPG